MGVDRRISLSGARKSKDMTQAELAKKLGVGRETVNKWETGKIAIKPVNLYAICYVCGYDADDIILPTAFI